MAAMPSFSGGGSGMEDHSFCVTSAKALTSLRLRPHIYKVGLMAPAFEESDM